ncbi:hypothetical protein [Pseudomonas mangiferae]|nr:hypothetical protein [Pseudomonas mangiferae]
MADLAASETVMGGTFAPPEGRSMHRRWLFAKRSASIGRLDKTIA